MFADTYDDSNAAADDDDDDDDGDGDDDDDDDDDDGECLFMHLMPQLFTIWTLFKTLEVSCHDHPWSSR